MISLQKSIIKGCVIGNNSYIGEGCTIEKSLVLGNDYYTNEKTRAASLEKGESALGIGTCFRFQSTAACTQLTSLYTLQECREASKSHSWARDILKVTYHVVLIIRPDHRQNAPSA